MSGINEKGLLVVCPLALLVVVVDLAQYITGYLNTRRHHRRLIWEEIEANYDRRAPLYRLRIGLFWTKQVLAGSAFLTLVFVVLPSLLGH